MKKIKTYVIYGFLFSSIMCTILFLGAAVQKWSISDGIKQLTILHFIGYWFGGLLIAYFVGKLGGFNKKK